MVKCLDQANGRNWHLYNGDSIEILQGIPSNSVHYSITSIPFASLYTYSNSDRDMGNSATYDEFAEQYQFLGKEWFRVMMPGRNVSIHCMNLPLSKERDGVIGLRDFRGDVIRWMQSCGFIYHSEVCIWKNPVTAMQRTKALGLLHKQIKKDSCMSRQGIPDYLVTFRKPGENPERVTHTNKTYPVSKWQNVASPVWDEYPSPVWWDINQSDTLNGKTARENDDERHICPLQLPIIERGLELWTNPGDVVLDPFNGIGSTGYKALQMGRKYVGVELKESYFRVSVSNLKQAESESDVEVLSLFTEKEVI
jgi:DNA modification methylase